MAMTTQSVTKQATDPLGNKTEQNRPTMGKTLSVGRNHPDRLKSPQQGSPRGFTSANNVPMSPVAVTGSTLMAVERQLSHIKESQKKLNAQAGFGKVFSLRQGGKDDRNGALLGEPESDDYLEGTDEFCTL